MPDQISGAQDKAFDQAPRLQIVGATNFFPRWDDRGSGGRHDFFSWRAKPPRGFHALGDLGVGHYYHATSDSQHLLVKAEDPDALRHPVRYDRVWGDWGSGANQDGSFWRPVPPAGYRALGLVCETGYAPPPLTTVVCVREEYLLPGELDTGSLLWNDADTGSDTDFACWQIVSQHVDGIVCGTFSGGASWTPPGWVPEAWVLNRLRVVLPAAASTDVSPGRSTNMIVAKEMIRFNKNGYPLDFHSIFGYPWQHQQAMLRLKDDAQGNRCALRSIAP